MYAEPVDSEEVFEFSLVNVNMVFETVFTGYLFIITVCNFSFPIITM